MKPVTFQTLSVTLVLCVIGGFVFFKVAKDELARDPLRLRRSTLVVHYAPTENLEDIDVSTIRQARNSVELAAYSLTDLRVIHALTDDARRGVYVSVYLDRDQTLSELRRRALAAALLGLASTPNATVKVKSTATLQHMKAYTIDAQTLRTGSANFSHDADVRQDNDLILTTDGAAIVAFERNFQAMFFRADNVPLTSLQ
jgi:phosphatidylserine/phosphatidylglycerophosphate/cardiolipin synthase-like enzyme